MSLLDHALILDNSLITSSMDKVFSVKLCYQEAKGHLVSSPSNQYSTTISKHFSSSIRIEAGFDWIFDNGWNVTSIFNRIEKDGFGHENALIFSAYKEFQNLMGESILT